MANETVDADELQQLAADLRVAAFRLARRLRLESQIEDVPDAQLTVLFHLSRFGSTTPGRLADCERVSAPSMNRTVNALVDAGFVRRVDDPDDGRRVIVELLPAGDEVARTARRRRNAWLREELRPLPPADRAAIARALELIEGMLRR